MQYTYKKIYIFKNMKNTFQICNKKKIYVTFTNGSKKYGMATYIVICLKTCI